MDIQCLTYGRDVIGIRACTSDFPIWNRATRNPHQFCELRLIQTFFDTVLVDRIAVMRFVERKQFLAFEETGPPDVRFDQFVCIQNASSSVRFHRQHCNIQKLESKQKNYYYVHLA